MVLNVGIELDMLEKRHGISWAEKMKLLEWANKSIGGHMESPLDLIGQFKPDVRVAVGEFMSKVASLRLDWLDMRLDVLEKRRSL